MPIFYDTSIYTHRNEVCDIPLSNVTVRFSEIQCSSCGSLALELLVSHFIPLSTKYVGGKRRCEGESSHSREFSIEGE